MTQKEKHLQRCLDHPDLGPEELLLVLALHSMIPEDEDTVKVSDEDLFRRAREIDLGLYTDLTAMQQKVLARVRALDGEGAVQ